VVLIACTASPKPAATPTISTSPARTSSPAKGAPPHVFVIVLENHAYEQLIGNPQAPYLNQLADRYGLATNYHAITHPSLPNYIAMTSGATHGISSDCTSCSVDAPNIGDQLEARGYSWRGYMEGMPSPCFTGASYGRYAKKHDPFVYYRDVTRDARRCAAHVVPLSAFAGDASSGTLPDVAFITPDLCHDMHDCSIATGDAWLHSFVPSILGTAAFRSNGILVITVDEDDTSHANRVPAIVVSARVSPGARTAASLTHYSLLRSIEDAYGLAPLGHAGEAASLFAALGPSS